MMLVSALYTMTVSCKREDVPDEMADRYITISSGLMETKSLMTSGDMNDTDNRITLFDLVPGTTAGVTVNINGKTARYGSPVWSIEGPYPDKSNGNPGTGYPWIIETGNRQTHNFFAWLTKDKDGNADGLTGFHKIEGESDADTYVYGTSDLTMNLTTQQFDFCYSDVIKRDLAATSDFSAVNIPLKHLFTSFGIKARNYDSADITIHSIELYGVKNIGSAKLTFDAGSGDGTVNPAITKTGSSWTTQGTGLSLLSSAVTVTAGNQVANVITAAGKGTDATDAFYLMLPQTSSEMEYNIPMNGDDPDMSRLNYSKAILVVEYSSGGGAHVTVPVSLCPIGQTQGWEAGDRHQIELAFTNKFLKLRVSVLPWDYHDEPLSLSKTIQARQGLTFTSCSTQEEAPVTEGDNTVTNTNIYFRNGQPIRCSFQFNRPVNGTWMVAKEGAFDAFEIDNELNAVHDGIDNEFGTIDGNEASILIWPKLDDPKVDYTINLSFSVRLSNGDVISANDAIYKTGDHAYDRYTIVLQH